MEDDHKPSNIHHHKPSTPEYQHPNPVIDALEWGVIAAFFATLIFGLFHFWLWVFSWGYKLAVHFHYLP